MLWCLRGTNEFIDNFESASSIIEVRIATQLRIMNKKSGNHRQFSSVAIDTTQFSFLHSLFCHLLYYWVMANDTCQSIECFMFDSTIIVQGDHHCCLDIHNWTIHSNAFIQWDVCVCVFTFMIKCSTWICVKTNFVCLQSVSNHHKMRLWFVLIRLIVQFFSGCHM